MSSFGTGSTDTTGSELLGDLLVNLQDVNINNPIGGEALIYDAVNGEWINGGGGAGDLNGLTDVVINNPQVSQVIKYTNNNQFENGFLASTELSDTGNIAYLNAVSNAFSGNLSCFNLSVQGVLSTIDTQNLRVADPIVELARTANQAPNGTTDIGFVMTRGSTEDPKLFFWDEGDDVFVLGSNANATGTTTDFTLLAGGISYENLKLNSLEAVGLITALTPNLASDTNEVATTEWVKDTIADTTDEITSDHTGVNYVGNLNATVTTHLSGIDTKLGTIPYSLDDLTDVALTGNLQAGEVLKYDGNNFVDSQLDYSEIANTPSIPSTTDDITSDHTGVNYVGNLNATVTTHLQGIDNALANAGLVQTVNTVNPVAGNITIDSDDIVGTHTGVNYVGANTDTITTHLSGLDTALANAGSVQTVNNVNPVAGNVTVDSDDIVGTHTGVNYTGLNTDTITQHLSKVDTALANAGGGATALNDLSDVALTGNLQAGEVLRYDGNNFVDAQLSYSDLSNTPSIPSSSDDITSDHTGVNYVGALNATITDHLSGIDTALANAGGGATALNDLSDVALTGTLSVGEVLKYDGNNFVDATLNSDDIPTNRVGSNYVGGLNSAISLHLQGIDNALGNSVLSVNNVNPVASNVTVDSDDIVGTHTGVNYLGVNTDTITQHLAKLDTAVGLAGGVGGLDDLSDVALTGNLQAGEVLRYDGFNFVDSTLASTDLSDTATLARLASPTFTGVPSGPTANQGTNTTQLATTQYVQTEITTLNLGSASQSDVTDFLAPTDQLTDLSDVTYNAGVGIDGFVLKYNHGQNRWEAQQETLGNGSLNNLSDVTISGVLNAGEVLRYSGAQWVDSKLASTDLSDTASVVRVNDNISTLTNDSNFIDVSGSAITSINSVNPVNQAVTLDSDDIVAVRNGTNYNAVITDDITTHLGAIDTVLGGLVGGLVYRGVHDIATGLPSLVNASQGDFFRISVGGIRYGQTWLVGDHLMINANMGGVLDNAKIDKIDNSTTVAQLNDLVDVNATNMVAGEVLRFNGGTNQFENDQLASTDLSDTANLIRANDNISSLTNDSNFIDVSGSAITSVNGVNPIAQVVTLDSDDLLANHTGVNYTGLNTDTITQQLAKIDTKFGDIDTSISGIAIDDLTDVTLTGNLANGEVLKYNGNNWVDAQLDYSEIANTPTFTTDDINSDHTGVNYVGNLNGTTTSHLSGIDTKLGLLKGTVSDISVSTNLQPYNSYQSVSNASVTHILPLVANSEGGDTIRVWRSSESGLVKVQQNGGDAGNKIKTSKGLTNEYTLNLRGEYTEFVFDGTDSIWRAITERDAYVENYERLSANPLTLTHKGTYVLNAINQGVINITLPEFSTLKGGDRLRFMVEVDRNIEFNVHANDAGNVNIHQNTVNHGNQFEISLNAGQFVELFLIEGLTRFQVQKELGSSSALDVGTQANNVVQLDAQGKLPTVDGSNLTNIESGYKQFGRENANFNANINRHYSVDTTNNPVTATLPSLAGISSGDEIRFFLRVRGGLNNLTIQRANLTGDLINGSSSFVIDAQYESVTLVANKTDFIWELV